MGVWVVLSRPVPGLYAGHLAEARRARASQGDAETPDEPLARALWAARALGVALDVLADARSRVNLDRLRFTAVRVPRLPDGGQPVEGALVAVGLHESGTDRVEVRFVPPGTAEEADVTRAMSAAVVELTFARPKDPYATDGEISLRRFVHGPGQTGPGAQASTTPSPPPPGPRGSARGEDEETPG